jgi:hypothetical protein
VRKIDWDMLLTMLLQKVHAALGSARNEERVRGGLLCKEPGIEGMKPAHEKRWQWCEVEE